MPGDDPLHQWVEEFRKEVEEVARKGPPAAPPNPAAARAQESFDVWWQAQRPVTEPAQRLGPEPILSEPAPPAEPKGKAPETGWAARVEGLVEEKALLVQQSAALSKENRDLRDGLARGHGEIASLEAKLQRSRDSHEAHLSKLEGQVRALEERLKTAKDDKTFLEQAFSRLEDANSRLEGELKLEREKNLMGERRQLELRQALASQEERASKAREEAAFQAGALEELRRQGASYRERLVGAKEATDADIAGLRQELKASAEEIKILLRTLRAERAP